MAIARGVGRLPGGRGAFGVALLLAPWPAAAAEVGVPGVHLPGLDPAAEEAAVEALAARLEQAGLDPVLPAELAERLRGRQDLVLRRYAQGRGLDSLSEGRVLYERAQPEQALPVLQRAVVALEDGLPVTGGVADLIDAWLLIGLAHAGMGRLEEAAQAFRQVAVLAPDRELDPMNYPPKVVALFESTLQEVAALPPGRLRIELPGEAEVRVDGRPAEAPGPLDLPPGTHHVFARGPDGARGYARVRVPEGGEVRVRLDPVRTLPAAPPDAPVQRARQARDLYRALGDYCDTDLLLVAGATGDGRVGVQVMATRTGNFSAAVTAPAGDDPVAALVDLAPVVAGYATPAGEVRADRVSLEVPPLDVSASSLLVELLLAPPPEPVEAIPAAGPQPLRWALVAGGGLAVAGGAGLGIAWALGAFGEEEAGGTIVFGPIP